MPAEVVLAVGNLRKPVHDLRDESSLPLPLLHGHHRRVEDVQLAIALGRHGVLREQLDPVLLHALQREQLVAQPPAADLRYRKVEHDGVLRCAASKQEYRPGQPLAEPDPVLRALGHEARLVRGDLVEQHADLVRGARQFVSLRRPDAQPRGPREARQDAVGGVPEEGAVVERLAAPERVLEVTPGQRAVPGREQLAGGREGVDGRRCVLRLGGAVPIVDVRDPRLVLRRLPLGGDCEVGLLVCPDAARSCGDFDELACAEGRVYTRVGVQDDCGEVMDVEYEVVRYGHDDAVRAWRVRTVSTLR